MMQKPIFLLLDELVNHFDLESISVKQYVAEVRSEQQADEPRSRFGG